jgi:hypothetical protein
LLRAADCLWRGAKTAEEINTTINSLAMKKSRGGSPFDDVQRLNILLQKFKESMEWTAFDSEERRIRDGDGPRILGVWIDNLNKKGQYPDNPIIACHIMVLNTIKTPSSAIIRDHDTQDAAMKAFLKALGRDTLY